LIGGTTSKADGDEGGVDWFHEQGSPS
jgi:hypothetical protein